MTRIRVSIEIDAPPAEVWAVVEHVDRHVDWMADAESIHRDTRPVNDGPVNDGPANDGSASAGAGDGAWGVGSTFRCVTKVGPIRLTDHMEITEWDPERAMGVRHTGIVTGSGVFTLDAVDLDRRTRFTWIEQLRFPWYLGGRAGALVGGQLVMRAIWRRNLRSLRRLVERSP